MVLYIYFSFSKWGREWGGWGGVAGVGGRSPDIDSNLKRKKTLKFRFCPNWAIPKTFGETQLNVTLNTFVSVKF